jgi:Na+/proline symporter
MLTPIVVIITLAFCGVFLWVSIKVKDSAKSSFAMYAIGGGALPLYLILFSDIATIMGAGNFIGHATHGFTKGISHIPFILGEQGSKIIFALVFAGFAGRFTYNTVSDMMYDLMHRDKITKAITGLLTGAIMLAWLGGQSKGLGYIFQQFTGVNPIPVIIFFNVAFIVYTYLGGILSVVWTDFIQGIIVVAFGVVFYYFAFAPIHWNLAELGNQLTQVAGPDFWDFSKVPIGTILVKFFTGCFGVLAAQVYWQRCFAAKDANTARTAMFISGVFVIIAVSLTALVGMTAKALNPGLDPALAMPWLMMNHVPMVVVAIVFALILAAAMSSADSLLNASAIIVINDIIYPFKPDLTDAQLVSWAKKATVIIGVLASFLALYAQTIIGMFSKAYTMAGGGVIPVLIVGLLWKISSKPFAMGEKNSRLTPWGVRISIVSGAVVSLVFSILWGIAVSAVLAVVVSLVTKPKGELEQTVTTD